MSDDEWEFLKWALAQRDRHERRDSPIRANVASPIRSQATVAYELKFVEESNDE